MEKIKLKIAYKLHSWFPKYLCWAGLVSWAYSDRLLIGLWKEFDSKKGGDGCKRESETHKDKSVLLRSMVQWKTLLTKRFCSACV
jgi:hypothetical protein